MRLGILGSTRGTHLATIAAAIREKHLAAEIAVVASNKPTALILERAQALNLPAHYIPVDGLSRDAYDKNITACLQQYQVDVVVLIGFMRILSASFVTDWQNKIINVHPSLLPAFGGLADLDVHRAVLAAGVPESGCTVHYVTEEVDAGPILLQKKCMVHRDDTPEVLKARVQEMEGKALVEALGLFKLIEMKQFGSV